MNVLLQILPFWGCCHGNSLIELIDSISMCHPAGETMKTINMSFSAQDLGGIAAGHFFCIIVMNEKQSCVKPRDCFFPKACHEFMPETKGRYFYFLFVWVTLTPAVQRPHRESPWWAFYCRGSASVAQRSHQRTSTHKCKNTMSLPPTHTNTHRKTLMESVLKVRSPGKKWPLWKKWDCCCQIDREKEIKAEKKKKLHSPQLKDCTN